MSHPLPHAASGSDKVLGATPSPPTTRHPVVQPPTTDKGGNNYIIKDAKYTYHKGYMALNNIIILFIVRQCLLIEKIQYLLLEPTGSLLTTWVCFEPECLV